MTSQEYLQSLRSHLKALPAKTRDEIAMEIGSHIQESLAQPGATLDAVLGRLGTPERVAAGYRDNLLLRRARRSFSPLVMTHAVARIATKGIFGFVVAICATIGYAMGGGMVLVALLKPILPHNTGLWIGGPEGMTMGVHFPAPLPPAHEILGSNIIPIALVLGATAILLTTVAIRLFLRTSHFVQNQFAASPQSMSRAIAAH